MRKGKLKKHKIYSPTTNKGIKIIDKILITAYFLSIPLQTLSIINASNNLNNTLFKDTNEQYINEEFKTINLEKYKNNVNNEQEVRENCSLLGIQYNDVNECDNTNYYYKTGNAIPDTIEDKLSQRYIPSSKIVRIIPDETISEEFLKLTQQVIDEINYIGKNIDDPCLYVLETNKNYVKKVGDISLKRTKQENLITGNNEVIISPGASFTSSEIENDGIKFIIPDEIKIDEIYTDTFYQAFFAHEMTHAITCPKEIEGTFGKLLEVSSIPYMKYCYSENNKKGTRTVEISTLPGRSIMMQGISFSAGDILSRAAKVSPNVKEKYLQYINFAQNYEAENILALADIYINNCDFSISLSGYEADFNTQINYREKTPNKNYAEIVLKSMEEKSNIQINEK